jgi:hypothetical protein
MGTITVNLGSIAGKVSRSANLADLTDEAAARTNLGLGSAAQDAATDFATAAQGAKADNIVVPKGYIDGLQMQWVSGTAVTVSSGTAYIPSLGNVLVANAAMALTGLSLTASTWYHLYLYSNAGTPAVECVTTAPSAPYNGTARTKTGDTSRRYIGSVYSSASSALSGFYASNDFVFYRSNGAILVNEFNAPIVGSPQIIDLSTAVAPTSTRAILRFQNNSSTTNAQIGPMPWDGPVFPIPSNTTVGSGLTVIGELWCAGSQIGANVASGTPNSNLQVLVLAYSIDR